MRALRLSAAEPPPAPPRVSEIPTPPSNYYDDDLERVLRLSAAEPPPPPRVFDDDDDDDLAQALALSAATLSVAQAPLTLETFLDAAGHPDLLGLLLAEEVDLDTLHYLCHADLVQDLGLPPNKARAVLDARDHLLA